MAEPHHHRLRDVWDLDAVAAIIGSLSRISAELSEERLKRG